MGPRRSGRLGRHHRRRARCDDCRFTPSVGARAFQASDMARLKASPSFDHWRGLMRMGTLNRSRLLAIAVVLVLSATVIAAQTARVIPRPPAQAPGPPKPE